MKHTGTKSMIRLCLALLFALALALPGASSARADEGTLSNLQDDLSPGGEISLEKDYTYSAADSGLVNGIAVPNTVSSLDLNGHTIQPMGMGRLFIVNSTLTLLDGSTNKTGTITGGNAVDNGGGVYVKGGSFTMTGGTISGSSAQYGGGVFVNSDASFTMTGGSITGNTAAEHGGGVCVYSGGSFTMTGGSITGNTAAGHGDGVYVYSGGSFSLSGAPTIGGEVYLGGSSVITVTGELTNTDPIPVTMENPGVFAKADSSYNNGRLTESDIAKFTSSDSGYTVTLNDEGEAELVPITWTDLQAVLGRNSSVRLVRDITADSDDTSLAVPQNVTAVLDLNGCTIDGSAVSEYSIFEVSGSLTLRDSSQAGGGTVSCGGDGSAVSVTGSFTMSGGRLTGGSGSRGVYVENGTFSLSGAPAIENGVFLRGSVITVTDELTNTVPIPVTMENPGVFTSGWVNKMGTADPADYFTSDDAGYAVRLDTEGELTLKAIHDVTVAENIQNGSVTALPAQNDGKYAEGDTVTLLATPTDGYALNGLTYTYTTAGGEAITSRVWADENGVFSFTMPEVNVSVTAKFVSEWSLLQKAINDAMDGETVKLERNYIAVSSDGPLVVPTGKTVTLDLNGHILNRRLSGKQAVDNGSVIVVNGTLIVTDNSTEKNGVITGGNSSDFGGGVRVDQGGSFTLESGTIIGNSADFKGGGVYVKSGSFTMTGGSISGNSADFDGGGVYVNSGSTFNMQGGSISGNSANFDGGGVYVFGGSFTMTGGSISGNSADFDGGGVLIENYTDSNNKTYIASFTLSGNPEITDNTEGTGESARTVNVYLYDDTTITIEDTLTNTAPIGVAMENPGVFTSGWQAQMGTADPANFFTSENADYKVYRDASGEARLSKPYAVTVDSAIENGSVSVSPARSDNKYGEGETVTLLATPTDGYAFKSFTVKQGETDIQVTNNSFTMPAGNVSVTATFSAWKWLQEEMEKGGTIKLQQDITCDDQDLGPLVVPAEKTVTLDLNGHTLNRGLSNGQAVDNGSVIVVNGTLTVTDSSTEKNGVITGGNSSGFGGGVYVNHGSFTLSGGSISGNGADVGGGVYVNERGTFILSGDPSITGNTEGTGENTKASNVYLKDKTITVTDALTDTASIGVTMETPGVFTYGWEDKMGTADPAQYFTSDGGDCFIEATTDGEAALVTEWAHLQTLLNAGGSIKLDAGELAGSGDITATACDTAALTVPAGKTVTLDLNGHSIDRGLSGKDAVNNGYVIEVNGALTVTDSSATEQNPTGSGRITGGNTTDFGGGVYVDGGSLILESGSISGNASENSGGGVYVCEGGSFTMTGGEISGNDTIVNGGGVYVSAVTRDENGTPKVNTDGSFTMSGGTISGNTAYNGSGVYTLGRSFEMTGGTISGNTAEYAGGGVTIFGRYEKSKDEQTNQSVYENIDTAFTMSGGTIENNTVGYNGGGVYIEEGAATFTMSGTAAINNNTVDNDANGHGGGVCVYGPRFDMTGGTISGNTAYDGGGVYTGSASQSFTMSGGEISGNTAIATGGGVSNTADAFTVSGGKISGNSSDYGGGVYVSGSFTLENGSISGNASERDGGGVYVSGSFTMTGGSISGNSADYAGGGVIIWVGSFTMTGGSISGNSANKFCGGVFVNSSGTFNMQGGSISGNSANILYGGVFILDGRFTLSGDPSITGNTAGSGESKSNVCLEEDAIITVGGKLSNTTSIGVTMVNPGVFTSGWEAKMGTADPANFFTSENEGYNIYRDAFGEARMSKPYKVTAEADPAAGGSVSVSPARSNSMYGEGETVTLLATPTDGYVFDSFTVTDADNNPVDVSDNTFIMPAGNVSVTAAFLKSLAHSDITIEAISDQTYTGSAIKPSVTVKDGKNTLTADTDYTTAYSGNINAGTATVTLTGKGNYTGTKTTNFSIGKADAQTITDVAVSQAYTLTGVSASVAGKMPAGAGTLTYTAGTPSATGSVTVSDFTVNATSGAVTATLSGGAADDIVTLPVTISSTNYTDSTVNVVITLTPKEDAGVSITGVPTSKTYGDAAFTLTGSVTNAGTGTGTWTWSTSDPSVFQITPNGATATVKILKAGSATVSAKYESLTALDTETTAAITVNTKALTIAAKNQSIYVDDTVPTLNGADFYTVTGLAGTDTLTTEPTLVYQKNGSAATPDNSTAGTYDIVPSGASAGDNYAITYANGTLTINPAPASVAKAPEGRTLTYNGSAQELVTGGEATNGTMQYALGTDARTAPTEGWSTSVPAKTDGGTYYVWYKAAGWKNYSDSQPACVTAVISNSSYAVIYHANGGTGAPATQIKRYNEPLTLSIQEPTRADSAENYVTTLDPNGGTLEGPGTLHSAVTTVYSFRNWNTSPRGTGDVHVGGEEYTDNAVLHLYAQWDAESSGGKIVLPEPTREGYEFCGWNTDSSAESGVRGEIEPDGSHTYYAIWKANAALPEADFVLPAALVTIEESAFEGLPMTVAEIPDGCESIGPRAFADCAKLTALIIPASVQSIDDTALEGSANAVIYGVPGSEAERFARANGILFIPMNRN